ncbi:MAG TPA: ABC transporter permease [Chitinophagaceae bacterium]|nr:ABC transporter permease [Chitinophagaceae bacterium]
MQSNSLFQTALTKLIRNKAAIAGLFCIFAALLVAIFAYWIAPDPSPNANRMILEISGQSPGFKMKYLKLKKNEAKTAGIIERTISGKPDQFTWIPITSYTTNQDSIIVQKYVDEDISERIAYAKSLVFMQGHDDISGYIEERTNWLGTDKYGRDILSRLIVGTRVSLSVGSIAVLISLTLGILLGALAGYYRGRTDDVIMWFINVVWSIPTLLLVFAITLVLGKGFWQVFVAVGLTLWVSVARMIRGQVFSIRELEYIEATRALGYSDIRTIGVHILPNVLGPVLVMGASNFATAIVIEAGLSFLGVGVQPPQPSWGLMIKENYNFIITNNPMLAIVPGLAIMILVLSFNLLGNGLRDALDVRS